MLLVESKDGALVMRRDDGGRWHAQAIVGMNGQRYSMLVDSARWTDGSFKVDPGGLHLWDDPITRVWPAGYVFPATVMTHMPYLG